MKFLLNNVGEYGIRYCVTEEYSGGLMVDNFGKIRDSSYGEWRKLLEWYETAGHTGGKGASGFLLFYEAGLCKREVGLPPERLNFSEG